MHETVYTQILISALLVVNRTVVKPAGTVKTFIAGLHSVHFLAIFCMTQVANQAFYPKTSDYALAKMPMPIPDAG